MTTTAAADHDYLVDTMTGAMVRPQAPFAGSDRLRPDGRPEPGLRAELRSVDDKRNAVTCVVALVAPAAVITLVAVIGTWWAVVAAIPVIATLQLRMFILHHEGAHRLLFSNRIANDVIGVNLMGWLPLGTGSHAYRRVHQAHHRDEFGPKEPDFVLYAFYPITRSSLARKLRRYITGVSAWRILEPRLRSLLVRGGRGPGIRLVGMQVLVFAVFAAAGVPWLYLWLWVVPYLSWYQVINRLRAVAEHGGMTRSNDRRNTTHIVEQSWPARVLLTPLNVGYHLAHHVDSGVPFRNLARLQQILIDDGYVTDLIVWPNYRALWRTAASTGASTAA